ncbi:MAG: proline--tRNA ligase, partial [Candidatus Aenigmatarchaeota archaeon]
MAEEEGLTVKKSEDFSEWYSQVVLKSALADYAPTQGCIVFREYSYAMWENMRAIFDKMIKATGH